MSEQGGPEEVDQAVERPQVRVRRIYEDPDPADGDRVLVDRLWPRGMSKVRAHLDEWCKQVAMTSPGVVEDSAGLSAS